MSSKITGVFKEVYHPRVILESMGGRGGKGDLPRASTGRKVRQKSAGGGNGIGEKQGCEHRWARGESSPNTMKVRQGVRAVTVDGVRGGEK